MDFEDILFLSVGAKTTNLWKSEEQFLSSHVLPTPNDVSNLKCNKSTTLNRLTESLSMFLHSLWRVYHMHTSRSVILLCDADDHPQFGRLCLQILGMLGLSRYPERLAVSTEPFPLFAARLHGTDEATVVVDLGHVCTRVVPVCHGIIVANSISFCAGLCTVPSPETSFDALLRRFRASEQLDRPEDDAKTELVSLAARYFFALEESLQDVASWCGRYYVASCMGTITVCGGGSDIPSLRYLLCAIVRQYTPFGRIYWS